MKSLLYKVECLTNLHVGSGDNNYSIVDKEVEKDPILECPIIHSSGIKGALRDVLEPSDPGRAKVLFGAPGSEDNTAQAGSIKFLDAYLLSRPLRTAGGQESFIQVTTASMLRHFIQLCEGMGCLPGYKGLSLLKDLELWENISTEKPFLCTDSNLRIEGDAVEKIHENAEYLPALKKLLGPHFAIARSLDDYPLPVIARNKLDDNKISKNLWYEEYVPHHSVFYLVMLVPENEHLSWLEEQKYIQFGGNASVGYGFTHISKWPEE